MEKKTKEELDSLINEECNINAVHNDVLDKLNDVSINADIMLENANVLYTKVNNLKKEMCGLSKKYCIKKNICNTPPMLIYYFQREKPYRELENYLESNHSIVCIIGESNIGKSEMANCYAYDYYHNKNVFWINSINVESIENSIEVLIDRAYKSNVEASNWENICNDDPDNTLIVFDNVHDYAIISKYLPMSNESYPKVIITSNYEPSIKYIPTYKIVELKKFSSDESINFIKTRLKVKGFNVEEYNDIDDVIHALGEKLNFMPKELDEAVKHILKKMKQITKRGYKLNRYTLMKCFENVA